MTGKSDRGEEQSRHGSRASQSNSLIDDVRDVPNRHPQCGGQKQGEGETPGPGDGPESVTSISCAAVKTNGHEEVAVMPTITDVTLDLQQDHGRDAERREGPYQADTQPSAQQGLGPRPMMGGSWDLSDQLLKRFEQFGDLADLQQAIIALRELTKSTVSGDKRRTGLVRLGVALQNRFDRLGELNDIEEAVSTLRDAVRFTQQDHPDKHIYLSYLGNTLTDRFERLGEASDLEEAILILRNAVGLIPHGHSDKSGLLNDLGNSILTRFERFGKLSDLEEALSKHRDAVVFLPQGHPDEPTFLSSLGNSLFIRFQRLGELSDLEDAIVKYRGALNLIPQGHPHKPGHLNNLGNSLNAHFERLGDLSALEDAISAFRDAVDLTPHDHPNKPRRLENLGSSFKSRFERLGELDDIKNAISTLREAVDLTPDGHPEKPSRLINLGNSLLIRFLHFGQMNDLEDALSRHSVAVDLTPHGHPDRPIYLNSLGNSYFTRFEHLGNSSDLEDAISILRNAVDLVPRGHPRMPVFLTNLGNSFLNRFEQCREISDLEFAIMIQMDVVGLTPRSQPDRATYLNNLGNSFFTRFGFAGVLSDLEDAISRHLDAVNLSPHGCTEKPSYLNSLGISLKGRFDLLGELSDLDAAISMLRDAINLTPRDHTYRPAHISNLGDCLVTRYKCLGQLSDIEEAISALTEAVNLIPRHHLDRSGHLDYLGDSFNARFEHLGMISDLEQAICLYSHAASIPIGPITVRFHASQKWILCARHIRHRSLLRAHSLAISILPKLAWIGLPLGQRFPHGSSVVREAAAAALDFGFPETAVEWLEQGRSIVWRELFQLRNSDEELSSAHPNQARRLHDLSVALDHVGATHEMSVLSQSTQNAVHHEAEPWRSKSDEHHRLAIERDRLLKEIRGLPGFERFLLHKDFSRLRVSAYSSGPVVILNAAENRCDALIVLPNVDHVIHVPLPRFTLKQSADLQNVLKSFIRHVRSGEREGKSAPLGGVTWESLLSPLWKCIVKPVLDALAFSVRHGMLFESVADLSTLAFEQMPGDPSRIFWCPTGPFMFLPLHGAGLYDTEYSQPGHKVFDFVVSSYVLTLAMPAHLRSPTVMPGADLRFLIVRQPPSDGLTWLPGVATEVEHIKGVIRSSPSTCTTLLESPHGTVEEVLSLMKEADWVHFACHGVQDATYSGLCLANQCRLKLHDIITLSRQKGGLAFLSACQTATGHEHLPDEAIHIAAGLLFAGYTGVVGTMWSISDKLAPDVARDVYEQLFQKSTRPDHQEAARALHDAIGRLRDSDVPFDEWLPFIHLGM